MGQIEQNIQRDQSWSRVLGVMLWSPRGRYLSNWLYHIFLAVAASVSAWGASAEYSATQWRVAYAELSTKTLVATTQNRCLGGAILSKLEPEKFPLPAWCEEPLRQLREKPLPPTIMIEGEKVT